MEAKSLKRKAKNKQWYKGQKKRKFSLCPDIKGFLLFCNHKEKEAIREAYNLLNEYADKLQLTAISGSKPETEQPEVDNDDDDLDAQLEKEKSALKAEQSADESEKRFQVVESGAQNVLFIRTTVPDPVRIVTDILDDIRATGQQRTRHLIRLIPIGITCKAYEANVKAAVETLVFAKATENEDDDKKAVTTTYQVLFKARCNQNLFKEDVIRIVKQCVPESYKPDLKNPDVCFVFEVIKSNCCVGILPNYFAYKKYNLIELAQTNSKESTATNDNEPANNQETVVKSHTNNKEPTEEPNNDQETKKPESALNEDSVETPADANCDGNGTETQTGAKEDESKVPSAANISDQEVAKADTIKTAASDEKQESVDESIPESKETTNEESEENPVKSA